MHEQFTSSQIGHSLGILRAADVRKILSRLVKDDLPLADWDGFDSFGSGCCRNVDIFDGVDSFIDFPVFFIELTDHYFPFLDV
jgi:hypothetical protein